MAAPRIATGEAVARFERIHGVFCPTDELPQPVPASGSSANSSTPLASDSVTILAAEKIHALSD